MAGMQKIGIGIAWRSWFLSVLDARFHCPERLGSDDPGLSFFQTIQEHRTNQVRIEARNNSGKLSEFVERWFWFHPARWAKFHNQLLFVRTIRHPGSCTTTYSGADADAMDRVNRDGRRRLMSSCCRGCAPASTDSTRNGARVYRARLSPRVGLTTVS